MITAVVFLVFALLCLYAGVRRLSKYGDDRPSQLSRGELEPVDWDRYVGALLLVAFGLGCLIGAGMALPPGWWHGG
ncbi:MAG: hypothetical protein HOV96_19525 [Nonomuraea sp.]|nr:hypothetical protein [Nonomuraea sp.]